MILMLYDALIFAIPCWTVNMALNGLYVAGNLFPNLKQYDIPLDGGKLWPDKRRILGNSTTMPGIAVAFLFGLLVGCYFGFPAWLGITQGLLVYLGHALGSFIKRRANYADGQYMILIDHGDYVITTGVVLGYLNQFTWSTIILGIVITYLVHPIVTYLSYLLKLHKYPR